MLLTIGLTFIGISLIIFIAGVIVACREKPEDQNEELRGKGSILAWKLTQITETDSSLGSANTGKTRVFTMSAINMSAAFPRRDRLDSLVSYYNCIEASVY